MKKAKKVAGKLLLSKETLRELGPLDLGQAAGRSGSSGWSCNSICPTEDPSGCHCG